jgi:hypothetical protein
MDLLEHRPQHVRSYSKAKTGSMPLETPAIRLRVPVGAMVLTVTLRIGAPFLLPQAA